MSDQQFKEPKNLEIKGTLTIKQLKEFVKDLPETNQYGEDFEVWLTDPKDDSLSYQAGNIDSLNFWDSQGQDILINPRT